MAEHFKRLAAATAVFAFAIAATGGAAVAQTVTRELDRSAACLVVAQTLAATGQIVDSGQAARINAIYANARQQKSSEIREARYGSEQVSQINSYYANKLGKPIRTLAALGDPGAIDAILNLCGEFG